MKRNTLNFVIDAVTLLTMTAMIWTGLLLRFVLPPGTGGSHGGRRLALAGLDRHDWGAIHFYLAALLAALIIVHVALHWNWVCGTIRRWVGPGTRSASEAGTRGRHAFGLLFLGLVAVVLAGSVWLADRFVEETRSEAVSGAGGARGPDAQPAQPEHDIADLGIDGSMTLAEAAAVLGTSVESLKAGLGLPDAVDPDERLGRLRREFDFRMSDVSRIGRAAEARPDPDGLQ